MPFDPAPREVKVGRFQHIANAILRGCQMSGPCTNGIADDRGNTCAYGALLLATGRINIAHGKEWGEFSYTHSELEMSAAYVHRYGISVADDNDDGLHTREEIAARIAAL